MMKISALTLISIFFLSTFGFNCQSQDKQVNNCISNRKAVFAGQFYEADSKKLDSYIDSLFNKASPGISKNVLAIISPHAGYIFSAQVAASAFNQIDQSKQYKHVFILAPSHHYAIDGAALYCNGNYTTPLGLVDTDCDLAKELIKKNNVFQDLAEAHANEHAIEVQLPFLQKKLKKGYKIVPIIIGTQEPEILKKIASELKPYLTTENLFVISSDFSHYPQYKSAVECDKESAQAILKNSPEEMQKQLQKNENKNVKGMVTSMCGEAGIMCLLYMTSGSNNFEYKLIDYKNSGDSKYGEKDKVVGYWAISLTEKENQNEKSGSFNLEKEDKDELLQIARKTLEEFIKNGKEYKLKPDEYTEKIKTKCGAFVTLTKKGELRGCVGSFSEEVPLYEMVRNMAISASSNDPRFPKVKASELSNLEIEISVLTPLQKIDSISQIKVGKHGIYIKKGFKSGTLLPQVAPAQNWSAEEFVKYCALYKAGISEDEIKESELYVYEAIVFQEK